MKHMTGDSCEEQCTNPDNINIVKAAMIKDEDARQLSDVFKVLGDPTRVKIIHALSNCELCVCDIAEVIEMTQSAVSHQLRLLRSMHLVKYRKDGKSAVYSLDDEHILQLFSQGMEHIRHI
ncbi:MAG: helix-turn-helix transcriptional regulator [Ruminiclostridium sp.]|nr:helix-turn-helix transcriptional regulator [Ruminiclostridium sp.]